MGMHDGLRNLSFCEGGAGRPLTQGDAAGLAGTPQSPASTLVEMLERRASALGDKVAFRYVRDRGGEEVGLSYRALHRRAVAIAGELQSLAAPGDRALLLFPPGLDFISAFFGCVYAGIVAVPAAIPGRNLRASSVMAIVGAASPTLILSTAAHREQAWASYARASALSERTWVATDEVPDDRGLMWRDPQVTPQHTAFLQFTSGSTASPKGVVLRHQNLMHNAEVIQPAFGTTAETQAVFWLPLHHDMGLIGGVLQPIYCGGSCTLLAAAAVLHRPAFWLETISQVRATISGGPDFVYDVCARKVSAAERAAMDLSCWELAFTGAERIRALTLERFASAFAPCGFRRRAFYPCYGLAEATLLVSGGPRGCEPTVLHLHAEALARHQARDTPATDGAARSLVGCGEVLPGQRIMIVDPQSCRPRAAGEVGEIWVQGPSVGGGYYERPETSRTVFGGTLADSGEGPFLRTGDLGFLREGQLVVTGRIKDLIIIRGRNYYPEDIEHSVAGAHAGLRVGSCAAFSIDLDEGEQLVVVQEAEPRARNLNLDAACHAIRRALSAEHEVEIYAIVLIRGGSIPKTSSGKTRRSVCREQYLRGTLEVLAEWKPKASDLYDEPPEALPDRGPRKATSREIEDWLIQRVAARLHVPTDQVRITTPFLEFGMGSLDAVEIAADLEQWLGRHLSPVAVYNHPNIAALSHWLACPPAEAATPSVTIRASTSTENLSAGRLQEEVRRMSAEDIDAFLRQEQENREPT
jgi:acyl-CoA synthetase (AMP-forming)/AMP-acid ligase II/acyl carrier protein